MTDTASASGPDPLAALAGSGLAVFHTSKLGRAYVADCLAVMAVMPDNSVDLVITSPPYERQPKYHNGERYDREWFVGPFLAITAEILRVLKPSGQFVLNFRSRKIGAERSTLQYELVSWLCGQHFLFVEDHVWAKPSPPPGRFKQATKDAIEYCFRFAKSEAFELYPEQCLMPARWDAKDRERRKRHAHNYERADAPGGQGRKRVQAGPDWVAPSNLLVAEPEFSPNPSKHPARFPPAVPEYFIKLCTRPGDVCFDPFAGTCTSGVVAEGLKRRWIMADLDREYVAVLPDRLKDLRRRMAAMPAQPSGTPDGLMWLPLPFALKMPKRENLRAAAKSGHRVDKQQIAERRARKDAAVAIADYGTERVIETAPTEPIQDGKHRDPAESLRLSP